MRPGIIKCGDQKKVMKVGKVQKSAKARERGRGRQKFRDCVSKKAVNQKQTYVGKGGKIREDEIKDPGGSKRERNKPTDEDNGRGPFELLTSSISWVEVALKKKKN